LYSASAFSSGDKGVLDVEEHAVNVKEIRDLSNEELEKEVTSLKEELYTLRFAQATGNLENPARMRDIKKTIARIKTVLTERASAQAK